MARFYRTATPYFVQDGIHNPPVEMMRGLIERKDAEVDGVLHQGRLIEEGLDSVDFLGLDRERFSEIQKGVRGELDNIVSEIMRDPMDTYRNGKLVRDYGRQFRDRRRTGDISHIEGRAMAFRKWEEDHKEVKKSNPGLYNRLRAHWMGKLEEDLAKSPEAMWEGAAIVSKPDIDEAMGKLVKDMKADKRPDPMGRYLVDNEWMDEARIYQVAASLLMKDPNFAGYVHQQGRVLGERGFFDKDGNLVPFRVLMDREGKTISAEEYKAMTDKERGERQVRSVLNPESAFYHDLNVPTSAYPYSRMGLEADPYALADHKAALERQNIAFRYRQMAAHDKLKEKDWLYQKWVESGGTNDLARREWEATNALDTIEQYVRQPPEFDKVLAELGIGGKVNYMRLLTEMPNSADAQMVREGVLKAEEKYKDLMVDIGGGEKVRFLDIVKATNMGLDPTVTIEGIRKALKVALSVNEDSKHVYSPWTGYAKLADGVVDTIKGHIEGYKNTVANVFNDEYYKQALQTGTYVVDSPVHRKATERLVRNNYDDFTILKNGTEALSAGEVKDLVEKMNAQDGEHVSPVVRGVPSNFYNTAGATLDFGNGETYFVMPHRQNTELTKTFTSTLAAGMPKDSPFHFLMANPMANHLAMEVERMPVGKSLLADVDGKRLHITKTPGGISVKDPDEGKNAKPVGFNSVAHLWQSEEKRKMKNKKDSK